MERDEDGGEPSDVQEVNVDGRGRRAVLVGCFSSTLLVAARRQAPCFCGASSAPLTRKSQPRDAQRGPAQPCLHARASGAEWSSNPQTRTPDSNASDTSQRRTRGGLSFILAIIRNKLYVLLQGTTGHTAFITLIPTGIIVRQLRHHTT